jgi:membrane protease subunit (stomatin/prohibitin family)
MMGLGIAAGGIGLAGLQQPVGGVPGVGGGAAASGGAPAAPTAPAPAAPAADDPVERLASFKRMLDQGLITQADYDAAKARALGL